MATIPGLDERYIAGTDLAPYFVDKDTGAPLAGGTVEFYRDVQRLIPKLVYTLEGPDNTGAYYYVALPNPITLSASGNFEDDLGNNVPVYYFPYVNDTELDLYYIVVKNALGVQQFVRQAWPTLVGSEDPVADSSGAHTNQISNSQFLTIGMSTQSPTATFSGTGSASMDVGLGWTLNYSYSGTGSITVTQLGVAGSANYDTNPPYILQVTPGANVTQLQLRQVLSKNPGIWANGYIAGGMLLGSNTAATMYYSPSNGTPITTILTANNNNAAPVYYTNTVAIPASANPSFGSAASVTIIIALSTTNVTQISSVQVTSCSQGEVVPYLQDTVSRQSDYLAHIHQDQAVEIPMETMLTGWYFPTNPAQFYGKSVAATGLANSSYYIWDQTLLYSSADSGFATSTNSSGDLLLTAQATGQAALVQYLDGAQARQVLRNNICCAISAAASISLPVTVSLWYTTGSLPTLDALGRGPSIVASLNSRGFPTSLNGTWTQIPTWFSNPMTATIPAAGTFGTPQTFNYWSPNLNNPSPAPADEATYFAIVVGFGLMSSGDTLAIRYISLFKGIFATYPVQQTPEQVLMECQYYWQKSYSNTNYAGDATFLGALCAPMSYYYLSPTGTFLLAQGFSIQFNTVMRTTPTLVLCAPAVDSGSALSSVTAELIYYTTSGQRSGYIRKDASIWTALGLNNKGAVFDVTVSSGITTLAAFTSNTVPGWGVIFYHYVADARLGVVS